MIKKHFTISYSNNPDVLMAKRKFWSVYRILWLVVALGLLTASVFVWRMTLDGLFRASPGFEPLETEQEDAGSEEGFLEITAEERAVICSSDVVECEGERTVRKETKIISAYNSVPEQTDASPEIAANGENIMRLYEQGDFTCAASMPFGTKLEVQGFGTCVVRDRLAKKYADRVDIHMGKDVSAARAWGKRTLEVSILK